MIYLFYFLFAFGLGLLLTPITKHMAVKMQALDWPGLPRKIHNQPVPLLGGLAIFFAFSFSLWLYLLFGGVNFDVIPLKFFMAIIYGGLVLMLGGVLDDRYNLPPKILWLFPALASLIIVWSGIGVGIKQISNPFGNPISLDFFLFGLPFSGIFTWVWLMGMIFTTKFLDGLDGLCAGISLIGGLTLFTLSLAPKINQPMTAAISIIFCGAILGYLFYGFYPTQIFLGESGSTFLGFMLGVISVILGGKIATALLVMGIPILDVAWVITRRLWYNTSPFRADRQHLHFRLLDVGFSQKQAILILWGISAVFGFVAVFLQSLGKLIALIILFCVMLALAVSVVMLYKRKHPHIPENDIIKT